jgi:DNA-binding transcriptional LysR family regulator
MDTDRLRYFCTVVQAGSLRQASELLRISPAALSKAIKILEGETGVKLMIPSGRGIAITDQGRMLASKSQALLQGLDELKAQVRSQETVDKPMRIASFEVFTTYFLGPALAGPLGSRSLILHELVPGKIEKALVDQVVDLGISYIPIPSSELDHIRVATIEMGVYARRGQFEKMELSRVPFAVPVEPIHGSPNKVQGLDGWPEDRMPRNVRYRVTLMESALELCRQGVAAAYLPRFVVSLHNKQVKDPYRLINLPVPESLRSEKQPVFLIKRKVDQESASARLISKALRAVCALE